MGVRFCGGRPYGGHHFFFAFSFVFYCCLLHSSLDPYPSIVYLSAFPRFRLSFSAFLFLPCIAPPRKTPGDHGPSLDKANQTDQKSIKRSHSLKIVTDGDNEGMDNDLNEMAEENRSNAVWTRMLQGNKRFALGQAEHPWQDEETRLSLVDSQNPDAAVLSCSDSRVPVEVIFDEGLGDIFTVRTAGATIDQAVLESLEYAVGSLHVSIIVVMSHQDCGLLKKATELARTSQDTDFMTYSINQALETVKTAIESEVDEPADIERIHISLLIERLVDRSEIIRRALADDKLKIVGARYVMTTGLVEVLSF